MQFDLTNPKTFHSIVNGYVISNNLALTGRLYHVYGDGNPVGGGKSVADAIAVAEQKSEPGPYVSLLSPPESFVLAEEPVVVATEETLVAVAEAPEIQESAGKVEMVTTESTEGIELDDAPDDGE